MKKSFVFILAAYLLLNTMGYQVFAHYCGNDLKSSSILIKSDEACCEGEIETPENDCCQDKSQLIQLTDQYLKSSEETFEAEQFANAYIQHFDFSFTDIVVNNLTTTKIKSPPGEINSIPIFISNCTFRI